MSKKIYCSIGPVPKGQRMGSMKECAERKQIRYYGVKKIDPKLLEAIKKGSKGKESRDKLAVKMIGLRGKVSNLNKQLTGKVDAKEKERLKKELEKTKKELAEVSAKFSKADKERKGGSRKSSKKRSRKGSRKGSRGGSRKGSKKGSRSGSRKRSKKGSRSGSRKRSRKGSK